MSEYSDYGMVKAKLHDGMYDGNMHACLRDVGRIAGGCFAAGRLSPDELDSLRNLAISLSRNKSLGARKWDESVAFGQKQPLPHTNIATGSNPQSHAIGWNEEVSPEDYRIVDANWLETEVVSEPDMWNPCAQLREYLSALFEPDEHIAYCTDPFERDGHYIPTQGTYHKTVSEILKSLKKNTQTGFEEAVGTPNEKCGAWIVINPVDGKGRKDENVTDFRYALIESDTKPVDEQVAIYKKLELPCVCIVHSGGKSAHAIVRVNAPTIEEYRKRVNFLYEVCANNGLPVDKQNRNPSRYSRMPGVMRDGKKQFIIERNCGKASFEEWEDWIKDLNDDLPDFEPLTEDEIQNPPPLSAELISGILRVNHKLCIVGPSKAGKSFLLIELAIAIAEGTKWLGRQCRQGRVLYINLELDKNSCTRRFVDVYAAMGIPARHYSFIDRWNLRGRTMPLDKLTPKLIRRAAKRGYELVIIDPIYKVLTGDENSASEMAAFCNLFDRISKDCGCAIVYCHHHSKGSQGDKRSMDRASGSGVFARDPDAMIDLLPLDAESARAVLQQRMECTAMHSAILANADGQDTLGMISQDDKIVPNRLEGVLLELWGEKRLDGIRKARQAAAKECESITGWRASFTLREFATPKPQNFWFAYPRHLTDDENYLADATPEGEQLPGRRSSARRDKKPPKQDKLTAFKQIVECNPSQVWTVRKAIEQFGVSHQAVSKWCKALGWSIKKGTICTPQPEENDDDPPF